MKNVIYIEEYKARKAKEFMDNLLREAEEELDLLDAAIAELDNDQ